MGSVIPHRPLFYSNFSSTPKHQMPPRRDTGFPPELTQLLQQQNALMQLLIQNQNNTANNPPPPPTVDNLTRFLRLNPPVFSVAT